MLGSKVGDSSPGRSGNGREEGDPRVVTQATIEIRKMQTSAGAALESNIQDQHFSPILRVMRNDSN